MTSNGFSSLTCSCSISSTVDVLDSELSRSFIEQDVIWFSSNVRIFMMSPILRPADRRSFSLAARRVFKSSICVKEVSKAQKPNKLIDEV